ncbi:2-succinyl-5-enolpyruvyl-6-hydroxy-3-cyclohexene-1-carboxylic-acid synthase [Thiocapsa imhoffii]|uniref:2-succinyl-5-enolpyruvyl-6-hydroxy-3-cyclohexene-1-carboxylate synthase n=1 Tax=Thiocapsa imhoffii TaxID=382777 RepID=A0A9X1B9V5_9GAMM|nr:2-succinyl-5-enolpyruvyl-6-hydroxy-3-cyclohexene-1-carboxylic-acid synthase [Thiocapsa imhoffii]MBK1646339.1 2-succinyl-5-enolpyruvyl-6-hydroxy-3-cyclohexene-1-carboxylic-acid synthase [Thiocapsa imhoffii]
MTAHLHGDQGCLNRQWSQSLFEGLIHGGVRDLVLSPGSRSTPLVLGALNCPELRLRPILDERSAAFYALGLAAATQRPVALLCTSGSAPAHWFPAVMEAFESAVPLLLLTADRPPELRAWGANQTVDQQRLFGRFVIEFHDPGPARVGTEARRAIRALGVRAAWVSRGPRPGPVHLNLPFREPLVPKGPCPPEPWEPHPDQPIADRPRPPGGPVENAPQAPGETIRIQAPWFFDNVVLEPDQIAAIRSLLTGPGVICCGPMRIGQSAMQAIWDCARLLGAPVLTDPLCGLRFTPRACNRVARYDSLLRNPATAQRLRPRWVLKIGRTPVSKTLQNWLRGVPSLLVDPSEHWFDPDHDVRIRLGAHPETLLNILTRLTAEDHTNDSAGQGWLADWAQAEQTVDALARDFLATSRWFEGQLITHLLARIPPGEGLFCANSLPIRQLDCWSGQRDTPLACFGHRGASGIDGQLSTFAGLNAGGSETGGGVIGLLGDLSFMHDVGGLTLLDAVKRPCIVLNNGGGRIFDYLPQHGLPDFERLWRTPSRVTLAPLAQAFALPHRVVEDAPGFSQALDECLALGPAGGASGLIEVRIDAERSLKLHRAFWHGMSESTPFHVQ